MKPDDEHNKILSNEQFDFALDFKGFTIDTCILERLRFSFESEPLSSLADCMRDNRKFILPKVIHDEILRHMTDHGIQAKNSFLKQLREAEKNFGISKTALERIKKEIPESPEQHSASRLNKFISSNRIEVLPMDKVDTNQLFELYAKGSPPFDKVKDKKHEFPDAAALLCLLNWAKENGKVLVVSSDKGWISFCKQYPELFYVTEDIDLIFLMMLPETANAVFSRIKTNVMDDKNHARIEIETAIREMVADAPFDIDPYPSGPYYVEADVVSADISLIELMDATPLNYNKENKVIDIKFVFKVSGYVEGQFAFSVYDSEDRTNYAIGDSNETKNQEWECEVFTQFSSDAGDWTLNDISLNLNPETIEFVDVEPHFEQD